MAYQRVGLLGSIPDVTKNLLIINCLVWLATMVFKSRGVIDLDTYLGLHYWQANDFNLAQLLTYMFMHNSSSVGAGLQHLFFNMFSLWMFGSLLERVFGAKRYLFYYISCGLGAALFQEAVWALTWQNDFVLTDGVNTYNYTQAQQVLSELKLHTLVEDFQNAMLTVGASGAVFGILLGFGFTFPNMQMFVFPLPFPVKAKWMVIGYGVVELVFGVTHTMSSVAHYAHLGGMVVGLLILLYWRKKGFGKGGFYG